MNTSESIKKVVQEPSVTFADIWQVAYPIKCDKLIKQKNGLSYIPWSNCWRLVMEHFPSATFHFKDDLLHSDGSMSVVCEVEIEGNVREMWLPVTNYANKVILNPNGRDINDSRMRCLVKTLSLFGFGFHVYQGVTQPEDTFDDPIKDDDAESAPKREARPSQPKGKAPSQLEKQAIDAGIVTAEKLAEYKDARSEKAVNDWLTEQIAKQQRAELVTV
jgi:hypothetical protein